MSLTVLRLRRQVHDPRLDHPAVDHRRAACGADGGDRASRRAPGRCRSSAGRRGTRRRPRSRRARPATVGQHPRLARGGPLPACRSRRARSPGPAVVRAQSSPPLVSVALLAAPSSSDGARAPAAARAAGAGRDGRVRTADDARRWRPGPAPGPAQERRRGGRGRRAPAARPRAAAPLVPAARRRRGFGCGRTWTCARTTSCMHLRLHMRCGRRAAGRRRAASLELSA